MRRLRDLAVRQKLMLGVMLTSGVTVMLVGSSTIIYEVEAFRNGAIHGVSVQAAMIGELCAPALQLDDAHAVQDALALLKARTDIVAACVYRADGRILASYPVTEQSSTITFPPPEADGHRLENGHLLVFRHVESGGKLLGTIYLRSNRQQYYSRLTGGLEIAIATMLGSTILAWWLAARLQRTLADPVLGLAALVEKIRASQDYSLRAGKRGEDEIGTLTDGFNRMLHDIQERDAKLQQAYGRLQSSEQRFRQLAESVSEVFWMTDQGSGETIYISPAYETVWGRTPDSLYKNPRSWLDAIHPQDQERVRRAVIAIQTGSKYDEEYRIVRPDKSIRWVRDRAFPIRDDTGRPVRIAGIAEDVTERKRTEEALRRLTGRLQRAQDRERRRIARELHDSTGQNLAALSMNLSVITRSAEALNPQAQRALAECIALVEGCVQEIRTLSYLLHPPMLDERGLESALRCFVDGFSKRSGMRVDLEVATDWERPTPEMEIALFRVVQESLTNAHRHSESSTASIRLNGSKTNVCLEVEDAGKGMAELRDESWPEGGGVGIMGMQERIKQFGGKLDIESSRTGTIVRVTLPIEKAMT